jgi:dipeptidyl aminopeptidase/acylaminoacyl peptidase
VREEAVEFFSEGTRVVGVLRLPDGAAGPLPAVVQGPGWLGLAEAKAYVPWHAALVEAGYAVLVFDYRGHGRSEGERGWILPERMVEDMINAVTYLETRPEVDRDRIGAFGIGATGAGNAIVAAAADPRIRCVAVQSVIADGALWLRRMRREPEWLEFRRRVAEDARTWVRTGVSELVDPRAEIMVAAPERASYSGKKDVDSKVEARFHLQSAAALMRYRPIDVVDRIAPRALLLISVADDVVTPDEHATALFERAGSPKRLVRQHGTTHYESYTANFDALSREIVAWYDAHLRTAAALEILDEEGR